MATPSASPSCTTPVCALPACPSCIDGYNCRLSVINSTCQCPYASCVKIGFNTGADNGNTDSSSSSPSIIGPVVGSLAGLVVIVLVAIFVIRRRKRAVIMLGQDDSFDSYSKRWNSTSSSDSFGNKDVIRIAYIPSIIGESPINNPEPSVQTGGVLKPNFTKLKDEGRNKHDSVSSLDEAVVMAVTSKATPQVMKLNAIKANQSDLIHRSNSLHSSNSIKRSQSQRRIANKHNEFGNSSSRNPSPLAAERYDSDSDPDSDIEESRTLTGRNKGDRSATPDLLGPNPFVTEDEIRGSASSSSVRRISSTTRATSRSSNPFLSIAESTIVASPTSNSFTMTSSQPGSPISDMDTTFTSIPLTTVGDPFGDDKNDPLSALPAINLRPWTSSSASPSTAMRDSTFSTLSDSRSSTRGDGEEIMIFWDGD